MSDQFLFGAVYLIEQEYTDQEIRNDLKNMKDCGFNLITLWPIANPWLAKSSHEWVFDRTRFVLDCCEELGMKAIMQLFGQNQAQEFMPDAALSLQMECQDECSDTIIKNGNCFWVNLNHPEVREYMDTYFREAIIALKDHPAVYGWDVFNEAHNRTDDNWTTEKYQQWLKEKYGTIRHLNDKWYRRYENFSQIRPRMRRAPYSIWSSLLPSVEYEKFRSVNLTEICKFLYDTAKKYDTEHPIIIDGTSSQITYDNVTLRNNDEFETAYVPDIYGATFYPKSWGRNYKNTPWTLSMYFTIPASAARQAGKPYFVNELQTHTQSVLTPGSEVSCEELVSWTLMCIFNGLQGMQLWRWRPFLHGYQATGRGLTLMDGTPNERAAAMKTLMDMIQANPSVFAGSKVADSVVGIVCNYDIRLFFDSLLKFGEAGESFWAKNMEGWYKLFWEQGIPIDFVDITYLDGQNEKTPVLVLPGAVSISEKQAQELCRYVENGGILIADGRMGTLNEWGCVPSEGIPGNTLSGLFGIVEIDVGSDMPVMINDEEIPFGFQYQKLKLVDQNTTVLASMTDGTPAIVQHTYGKGKTLYFNSFEGLVLLEKDYPQLRKLVHNVIEPVVRISAEKDEHVHLAYLEADGKTVVLAINFSDEMQKIQFKGIAQGSVLKELFTGNRISLGQEGEILIDANSHNVYMILEE